MFLGWMWPVVGSVLAVIMALVLFIIALRKRRNLNSRKGPQGARDGDNISIYNEITEYIPTVHNPYNVITEYIPTVPYLPSRSGVSSTNTNFDQEGDTDAGNTATTLDISQIEDTYLKTASSTIAIDDGHTNKTIDPNQSDDTYLKPVRDRNYNPSNVTDNENKNLEMLEDKQNNDVIPKRNIHSAGKLSQRENTYMEPAKILNNEYLEMLGVKSDYGYDNSKSEFIRNDGHEYDYVKGNTVECLENMGKKSDYDYVKPEKSHDDGQINEGFSYDYVAVPGEYQKLKKNKMSAKIYQALENEHTKL